MGKSKIKKVKAKTHKATAKRFKLSSNGKVKHQPQGSGNGHSRGFMNRRQRAARKSKTSTLNSAKEASKIRRLLGK